MLLLLLILLLLRFDIAIATVWPRLDCKGVVRFADEGRSQRRWCASRAVSLRGRKRGGDVTAYVNVEVRRRWNDGRGDGLKPCGVLARAGTRAFDWLITSARIFPNFGTSVRARMTLVDCGTTLEKSNGK